MRKENLWGEWVLENAEHLAADCPYFGYLTRLYYLSIEYYHLLSIFVNTYMIYIF